METSTLSQQPFLRTFIGQRSSTSGRPMGPMPKTAPLKQNVSGFSGRRAGSGCSAQATAAVRNKRRLQYSSRDPGQELLVSLQPDYSDLWRLEKVVEMIKDGAVSEFRAPAQTSMS